MNKAVTCDILVLTIIKVELEAARRALKLRGLHRAKDEHGTIYLVGDIRSKHTQKKYRVALACVGQAGNNNAAALTAYAIAAYRPQIVLASGIGGGLRGKLKIGSVVFSEQVVGYESGAIREKENGVSTFEARPSAERPAHSLIQDILHYSPNSARLLKAFNANGGTFPRPPAGEEELYRREVEASIAVRSGTIGSGEKVIKSTTAWAKLQSIHGKIEVVEMEAKGIADACLLSGTRWLVIRGVSDFGDEFKKDEFHVFAATAALTVLADFIIHGLDLSPTDHTRRSDTKKSDRSEPGKGRRFGLAVAFAVLGIACLGILQILARHSAVQPTPHYVESAKVLSLAANYERTDSESRQIAGSGVRLGIGRTYNSGYRYNRGAFGLGWHNVLETAVDSSSNLTAPHIRDGFGSTSVYSSPNTDAQADTSVTIAQFGRMDVVERAALVSKLSSAFPLQSADLFGKVWISADSILLWRETAGGRVRFTFTLDGRLASIGTPGSPQMNIDYGDDQSTARLSMGGMTADLRYDKAQIVGAVFSDGVGFQYEYDSRSRLSRVIPSSTGAELFSYIYDAADHLSQIVESGLRVEQVEYDGDRRARVLRTGEAIEWTFLTPTEVKVKVERRGRPTRTVKYGRDATGTWDMLIECLDDGSRWALSFVDGGCQASKELRVDGSVSSFVRDDWGKVVEHDAQYFKVVISYDEKQRISSFVRQAKPTGVVETYELEYRHQQLYSVRSSSGWSVRRFGEGYLLGGPPSEACRDFTYSPSTGQVSSQEPGCPTTRAVDIISRLFWNPIPDTDSLLNLLVYGRPPLDL